MVQWNETPEFLGASGTNIFPSRPTIYSKILLLDTILSASLIVSQEHQGNLAFQLLMSLLFTRASFLWSKHSMPDIMYVLKPSKEWCAFAKFPLPPQRINANGRLMYVAPNSSVVALKEPNPPGNLTRLLDFPILPEKVLLFANLARDDSNSPWYLDWHM